ncbi:MAG TPA: DoxX family membrane protein [Thermodesulfobium narugense]|nr:DoxX family membrane protein [Thermodesulfobium narugense]
MRVYNFLRSLTMQSEKRVSFDNISNLLTPIRLILGWQFFSAFLRRTLNDPEKLDPNSPAYIGHAFNHFLPHALFIKPMIEFLITHVHLLYIFLLTFTIIEGLVGIGLILGLLTRLSALGAALLSFGILLGSGWLGSTCVDEWQIGIAGIGCGIVVMCFGGGQFSIDYLLFRKRTSKILKLLTSGLLDLNSAQIRNIALIFSLVAVSITLFTYQALHNGLYGKLYNLSKVPKIEILSANLYNNGSLKLLIYRVDGPDTYGAFVRQIIVSDDSGNIVETFDPNETSVDSSKIKNFYLNKVEPNKYSLVVPLGAKAEVEFLPNHNIELKKGKYKVELIDISGLK